MISRDEPEPDQTPTDQAAQDQRLPCGRLVADILEQVAEQRVGASDQHQRHCPHCQAALSEYQRLWSPVLELAAQRVHAPEGLQESVMRRIRGVVENTDFGVFESPRGITRIAARVIVVTARETAEAVDGVRVALSRQATGPVSEGPASSGSDPRATGTDTATRPGVVAGVSGHSTAIEITLAVDYGHDLLALADRVRRVVVSRIRALTDLDPVAVTVIIDDIFT